MATYNKGIKIQRVAANAALASDEYALVRYTSPNPNQAITTVTYGPGETPPTTFVDGAGYTQTLAGGVVFKNTS